MNGDTSSDRGRWRGPPRRARVLAVTAALVLLAAACSRDPSSTGSGGSPNADGASNYTKALAYTQCMRSHGVPNYPDPTSTGELPRIGAKQLGISDPRLQAAENDCQHLLPNGGQPSQPSQQQLNEELKFAQCMRSHGVPSWPDPINMGGEYEFNLHAANIDPTAPQAKATEQRCQSQLHLSKSQVHLPV